jgi:hypothetical protein
MEQQVQQDQLVKLVPQVLQDQLACQVLMEQQVPQELLVYQVLMEQQVQQVQQD